MRLKVRAPRLGALTLRLADSLVVQSVVSDRVRPAVRHPREEPEHDSSSTCRRRCCRTRELTLTIAYGGRLEPQTPDRETLHARRSAMQRSPPEDDAGASPPEPSFLYSSRSYWYPQATGHRLRDRDASASRCRRRSTASRAASSQPGSPGACSPATIRRRTAKVYVFTAHAPAALPRVHRQPLRRGPRRSTVASPLGAGSKSPMSAAARRASTTQPESDGRSQPAAGRSAAASWPNAPPTSRSSTSRSSATRPYASFTVALVESDAARRSQSRLLRGAQSAAADSSQFVWRNDPAAFAAYPDFFLAHELAHQWWGQAVGWRNYHEQWLSEGFAQYFAALYAQHQRGDEVFAGVLRQMRRWGMRRSRSGPDLSRLPARPHPTTTAASSARWSTTRAPRSCTCCGGWSATRRSSAGCGASIASRGSTRSAPTISGGRWKRRPGVSLERFFERWIYGSTLPRLTSQLPRRGRRTCVLHVEQIGEVFDVPVTVHAPVRRPASRSTSSSRSPSAAVEMRVPLAARCAASRSARTTGRWRRSSRNLATPSGPLI